MFNLSTLLPEAQESTDLRRRTSSLGDHFLQKKKQQHHMFPYYLLHPQKIAREGKRVAMETRKAYTTDLKVAMNQKTDSIIMSLLLHS
ncbi:hypothetical protein KSF_011520 [Reticulibacter mediterranei]|uniref:Uncharacterized protein n=1 Tax=Reticulibacter mediterranei TaxID=2778369 RepID=A0A8J3MXL5_9CHLR|nr:hypothetical protein KSF_011520 [Reticulibacter mediterranei]